MLLGAGAYGAGAYGDEPAIAYAQAENGHAFDRTAYDSSAFDCTAAAVSAFGGAPRPFFSYSGERLVWAERPLVAKVVPLTPSPIPVITGAVNAFQSNPRCSAQAKTRFVAEHISVRQEPSLTAALVYVPLSIIGAVSCAQEPPWVNAKGEMIDVELESFAVSYFMARRVRQVYTASDTEMSRAA